MIKEIRRQFKEIPGLLEGKAKPDTARCVDIATQAAEKNDSTRIISCFGSCCSWFVRAKGIRWNAWRCINMLCNDGLDDV